MLDAVIVGGGAAGLSLAAHLAAGGWDEWRVVVVDDPSPVDRARSWGYWSPRPLLVDRAAELEFDHLVVHAAGRTTVVDLDPYRYRVVRAPALHALVARILAHAPGFEQLPGRVTAVVDGRRGARVYVGGGVLEASWVFDSTGVWSPGGRHSAPGATGRRTGHPPGHRMVFTGWAVRTDVDVFDPRVPRLCDFRLPAGRPAFVHVLPRDARHALVEHTAFVAPGHPAPDPADTAAELTAYLRAVLLVRRFRVDDVERAAIPLSPARVRRRGHRVLSIGATAGLVRASSGYGFTAIQRDSEAVARSLLVHGHPFAVPARPWRHRALDALFLRAVAREPQALEPAFAALFGGRDPLRVLRFLDDDTTTGEDLRLVTRLPPRPFVRALLPRRREAPGRGGGPPRGGVEGDLLDPGVPPGEPSFSLVGDPFEVVRGAAVGELDPGRDEQAPPAEQC